MCTHRRLTPFALILVLCLPSAAFGQELDAPEPPRPDDGTPSVTSDAQKNPRPTEGNSDRADELPSDIENPEVPEGQVVDVLTDSVVVSLGTSDGIEEGDTIKLFARERIELAAGDTIERSQTLAVGRAVDVGSNNTRVTLGLNERVPSTALARPTDGLETASPSAPPRVGDVWELRVAMRPMLALGTVGGGSINSARAVYRFDGPFALHFNTLPLGVAGGRQGIATSLSSDAMVAYDGRIFSIGLGAGVAAIDDYDLDDDGVEGRATLMLSQFARLGARDGFNLTVHNSFYLGDEAYRLLGIDGSLQIPLSTMFDDSWFIFHAGGRTAGHAIVEGGFRFLLHGNGGRGSLFATFTAGGGSVLQEVSEPCTADGAHCEDTIRYSGPLVGTQLEWRL